MSGNANKCSPGTRAIFGEAAGSRCGKKARKKKKFSLSPPAAPQSRGRSAVVSGYTANGKHVVRLRTKGRQPKLYSNPFQAALSHALIWLHAPKASKFLRKHAHHKKVRPYIPLLTGLAQTMIALSGTKNNPALAVATFQFKTIVDTLQLEVGGSKEYLRRARKAKREGRKDQAATYYRGAFQAIVKETRLTYKQKIQAYGMDPDKTLDGVEAKPIDHLKEIARELRHAGDRTSAAEVYRFILYDRRYYRKGRTGLRNYTWDKLGGDKPLARLDRRLSKSRHLIYARLLAETAQDDECVIGEIEGLKIIHLLNKKNLSSGEMAFLKANGALASSDKSDIKLEAYKAHFDRYMKRGQIHKARAIYSFLLSMMPSNSVTLTMSADLDDPAGYAIAEVEIRLGEIEDEKKKATGMQLVALQREETKLRLALKKAKNVPTGEFSFGSMTKASARAQMAILLGVLQCNDRLLEEGLQASARLGKIAKWDEKAKRIKMLHLSQFPVEMQDDIRKGKLPLITERYEQGTGRYTWHNFYPTLKWVNNKDNMPILALYRQLKIANPKAAARLASALRIIFSTPRWASAHMGSMRVGVDIRNEDHDVFDAWVDNWTESMSGIDSGPRHTVVNNFYKQIADTQPEPTNKTVHRFTKRLSALSNMEEQVREDMQIIASAVTSSPEVQAAKERLKRTLAELLPRKGTLGSAWLSHRENPLLPSDKDLSDGDRALILIGAARKAERKSIAGFLFVRIGNLRAILREQEATLGKNHRFVVILRGRVARFEKELTRVTGFRVTQGGRISDPASGVINIDDNQLVFHDVMPGTDLQPGGDLMAGVGLLEGMAQAARIEQQCLVFIQQFVPASELERRLANNDFIGLKTSANIVRAMVTWDRKNRQSFDRRQSFDTIADMLKKLNALRRMASDPKTLKDPAKLAALTERYGKLMRSPELVMVIKEARKATKSAAKKKALGAEILFAGLGLPVGAIAGFVARGATMWLAARSGMAWGAASALAGRVGTGAMLLGITQVQMAPEGNWFGVDTRRGTFAPLAFATTLGTNFAFQKGIQFAFKMVAKIAGRMGVEVTRSGVLNRIIRGKDGKILSAYELGSDARMLYKLGLFTAEMTAMVVIAGSIGVAQTDKRDWGFNLSTARKILSTFGHSCSLPELAHLFVTTIVLKGAGHIMSLPKTLFSGKLSVDQRIFIRAHIRNAQRAAQRVRKAIGRGNLDLKKLAKLLEAMRKALLQSVELMEKHGLTDKPQYAVAKEMLGKIDAAQSSMTPMVAIFAKGNACGVRTTKEQGIYTYKGKNKADLILILKKNPKVDRHREGVDGRIIVYLTDGTSWTFVPHVRWARTGKSLATAPARGLLYGAARMAGRGLSAPFRYLWRASRSAALFSFPAVPGSGGSRSSIAQPVAPRTRGRQTEAGVDGPATYKGKTRFSSTEWKQIRNRSEAKDLGGPEHVGWRPGRDAEPVYRLDLKDGTTLYYYVNQSNGHMALISKKSIDYRSQNLNNIARQLEQTPTRDGKEVAWFFLHGIPKRNAKAEYGWTVEMDKNGRVTGHSIFEGDPSQVTLRGGRGKNGQKYRYELAHYHPTVSASNRNSRIGWSVAPAKNDIRLTIADVKKMRRFFGNTQIPESAAYKNGKYYHYVISREGVSVIEYNPAAKAGKHPIRIFFSLDPKGTGNSTLTKRRIARELSEHAVGENMPMITDAMLPQVIVEVPWATRVAHPAYKHFVPQRRSASPGTSNANGEAPIRFYPHGEGHKASEGSD